MIKDIELTFNEWKNWVETNKRIPSKLSNDSEEKSIASRIKTLFNKKNRSNENLVNKYIQIYKKYGKRTPVNTSHIDTFKEWENWCESNKRLPNRHSQDAYERRLANKMYNCYCIIKNNPDEYEEYLLKYIKLFETFSKRALCNIPSIRTYNEWLEWVERNKRVPDRNSADEYEANLAYKIKYIIQSYKRNKLKYSKQIEEYDAILDKYNASYVSHTVEETFNEWKEWTNANNSTPKRHSSNFEENKLAARMCHAISKCNKQPTIYQYIIQEYTIIYEKYNKRTNVKKTKRETLDEWKNWCEQHGRIPKPTSTDDVEVELYMRMIKCIRRMRDNKKKYSVMIEEYEECRIKYKLEAKQKSTERLNSLKRA